VAASEKLQSKNAFRAGPRADLALHNIPLAHHNGPDSNNFSNNFGKTVYASKQPFKSASRRAYHSVQCPRFMGLL
jgi:hypothetical protein